MKKDSNHIDINSNKELKVLPFKVEEGYFETLNQRIHNAVEANESLLHYNLHVKESPFQIPHDYFSQLEDEILDNQSPKDLKKSKTIVFKGYRNWVAVAASVLVILSFIFLNNSNDETINPLDGISSEAIEEYIDPYDLDLEFLAGIENINEILDDFYLDEVGDYTADLNSDLELEYDFELYEY